MAQQGVRSLRATRDSAALRQQLSANSHTVAILSVEEFDAMVHQAHGSSRSRLAATWAKLRPSVETGANWYASGQDVVTLTRLVADLGAAAARVEVRHYGGRAHIILKGYAGRRDILTGVRYSATHPKVLSMGLGRVAAEHAARQGGILTIILLTAYRVVDHFLTDTSTLTQLIGTLASDVVKVGLTVASALSLSSLTGSLTIVGTYAIGPLAVVILAGFVTTLVLDSIDRHWRLTDRLIEAVADLEATAASAGAYAQETLGDAARALVQSHVRKLILTPR
jgi:hypothetical protein